MRIRFVTMALLVSAAPLTAQNGNVASGGPFEFVDPGYTARHYAASLCGYGDCYATGIAFDQGGNLIRRSQDGATIYMYAPGTSSFLGAQVHNVSATHNLGTYSGWGMASTGNNLYMATNGNLAKVDLTTFTVSNLFDNAGNSGAFYGLKLMANGNLVYNSGNTVRIYDFATQTSTQIYNDGNFLDDIATSSDGHIFVAALSNCSVRVLSSTGSLINSISSGHCPDGIAYGAGAIFANNTDGTVTRYDFSGPNFTGSYTTSIIATSFGYHDFGAVGPDGKFYLDVDCVRHPGGFVCGQRQVVTLEMNGGGGFDPGVSPEPASIALMATGLIGIGAVVRRRRHRA